jgi:hypothetical protein
VKDSFIRSYLEYRSGTEVPVCFSRWAAIAAIATILSRNTWIQFGDKEIYANQYIMLIGSAGTRKSTAIDGASDILHSAGVSNFSAERTSKEKFLLDLAGESDTGAGVDNILERNLGFDQDDASVHPLNIYVGEANDFFGVGNIEFLSMLGNLWDWTKKKPYENRIKTGKSVAITNPILNIFAGNTPAMFAHSFPPEIIGQGFFSRLLLVYGEPNGKKISDPQPSDPDHTATILTKLRTCSQFNPGTLERSDSAKQLLSHIYETTKGSGDSRFDSYYNRRFTHLLKLCIVIAASNRCRVVEKDTVIEANTYLSYIESLMPKALGEFGKARNSDISHKVLGFIESRDGCSIKEILKFVGTDLEKPSDIGDILKKLQMSEKIQSSNGIFLPIRQLGLSDKSDVIDLSYLSEEELAVKG